ncbi:MAG: GDP-L-fucose synthase [Gammaproteobacteria bacterium]
MEKSSHIFIAGSRGLVGSALERRCRALGYDNLLLPTRKELDLCSQQAVDEYFAAKRPEYVFLAAARVGGIHANNTMPADFIRDNLFIATNVIDAAWRAGTRKLLFLGSSCIYPKLAPQPLREESLLTGALEPTNEWYAIAKLAGLKMCQAYRRQYGFDAITALPTNLYGPGDNFDLETSHVLPALLRKFGEAAASGAPAVTLWGTGTPRREFLHVDDLADACVFLMHRYSQEEPINIGCGEDLSIHDLAMKIAQVTGFEGRIALDATRPDGTPRKILDVSRLNDLGWQPRISLDDGLASTWDWYTRQLHLHGSALRGDLSRAANA